MTISEAIKHIQDMCDSEELKEELFDCELEALRVALDCMRVGHWEDSPTGNPDFKYCSECGGAMYMEVGFEYCPHCGAKMEVT